LVYVPVIPGTPGGNEFEKPETYGLSLTQVQDKTFISADGESLQAYFVLHPRSEFEKKCLPTILYLHENAGNLSHRFPNIKTFIDRVEANVLILSYRGFGNSSGAPSETGLILDSIAALRWLHGSKSGLIDKDNIILFGRSLGGAAAIALSAELNRTLKGSLRIKCLIVENSFVSVPILVSHLMPLIAPLSLLITNPWRSLDRINEINPSLPILFISGGRDELIPQPMMRELFGRCSSTKKEWSEFAQGTHMETWQQPGYWATVTKFIEANTGSVVSYSAEGDYSGDTDSVD